MLFILMALVAVGGEVLAKSPPKKPPPPPPPLKCPIPTGPYVPPKCGPNAYFEICSKPCPPQNCSSLYTKYACKDACCRPECRCKDGYLRDDKSGKCISVDECLFPCGPLQHFVRDSRRCQRTCANYKVTDPQSVCKPFTGCVCNKGRVRLNDDGTGNCVLPKQCPARKCPIYEHYEDCPSICLNETCASKTPGYSCQLPAIPLPCKPRCICNKGYLRDSYGNCIPENCCPIKKCPANEVYRCTSMCSRDSCARGDPDFKCPIGDLSVCIPACACKDGYLRNDHGKCIPRKLCPKNKTCGINEVAVKCATVYPPQTCESTYTVYKFVKNIHCKPGCDCRPGYLRNKYNICIPKEFCPSVPQNQCGPYQEYKTCGTACEPSCSDQDNRRKACKEVCVRGCFCIDGYVKDEQGNCVTRDKCPPPVCNKPNEVGKNCGSGCEIKTCDDYKRTDIVCPAVCIRGCFCRKGYVRNAYGVCVLPKECPPSPVCLLENEEYQPCGSSCPDNCDNYKDTSRICTANCVAACNCKAGFVRNLVTKKCVKPEQCPTKKCTGLNEALHYCASYCPVTCANRLNNGDRACATVCRVACDCIPGTLRNDSGICVPVEQCTPPVCRPNEIYQKCGTACPLTCDNYKNPPRVCTLQCIADCFCAKGYVRDRNLRCVKPEDCEPICPAGEKFDVCSAHCQDTCENYDKPNRTCTYQCQSGCVCDKGTVRMKDGKCVSPLECLPLPKCAKGTEVYSPCSAHCEQTCENSSQNQPCTRNCVPGCKCIDGLVRRKDGKCVKIEECSKPKCPADEVYDPCSAHCQDTCENHGPDRPCTTVCISGCRCGKGLVRRKDGKCVKLKDCTIKPQCTVQEVYDKCSAHCEPTCENDDLNRQCIDICKPGCKCVDGLVRRSDGKCVKKDKCKCENPQCPVNERWVDCVAGLCVPKTCDELGYPVPCPGIIGPCKGGCVCIENYVRNSKGICIPQKGCPSCGGDFNATSGCGNNCGNLCSNYNKPNNCYKLKLKCQYNGCDCKHGYVFDSVTERCLAPTDCPIPCNGDIFAEKKKCPNPCPPTCAKPNPNKCKKACVKEGCQCRSGFILGPDGKCTKVENCPDNLGCNEDPNAIVRNCPSPCPLTCENQKPRPCPAICLPPGCECKYGYILSKPGGKCIKADQCANNTSCSDPNAVTKKCALPESCRPTCAQPNPRVCPKICVVNGCECKPGYVLSGKGGKCIKIADCPRANATCNGDPNAVIKANPPACPSTCAAPNGFPGCKKQSPAVGCECKPGYLLSKDGGKCILPDQCPGGNPCGKNATFVPCRVNCPNNKCPVDDSRAIIACSPPYPCPSGCSCRLNYRRRSYCDDTCILASDCPPVKCKRPNEIYSSCPSACLRENCADVNDQPKTCNPLVLNCQPQCICKKGYFRNASDICIPAKQCPINQPCGDPNAERVKCAPVCRSTCAKPDPGPCILKCKLNDCVCKKGYILSQPKGKCVPVDKCPRANATCNGDPNAVIKANPPACPPTCDAPNGFPGCKKQRPAVGCECKPGYLLSKDGGKCILSDQCPGGNPCGKNATFVQCRVNCPHNKCPVDDSRAIIACKPPHPCPSGCSCRLNYRRRSSSDDTCILASECPPVKCKRPNEIYSSCPSACLRENCADVNDQPKTCNPLVLNCQPQCICKKGYFRNDSDICIPAKQCPINEPCSDPNAERVECAPVCRSTCAKPDPGPCILKCKLNDCVCKKGYILSQPKGKCVPVDKCPRANATCNGDPNAVIKANPPACPSTCAAPNGFPGCKKQSPAVGCECKPGYLLSKDGGKCILPDQCPGGNPCGRNATFVPCRVNCPNNKCPVDDSRAIIACKPPHPCPSGCSCRLNYRRRSSSDDTCILASECPPVKCKRPNEIYSSCPSACLRENCADVNDQPKTCNPLVLNCQPQCICKKGYFRNASDICIPAKQCPINQPCSDPNARRFKCAPVCRPTCAKPVPGPCKLSCILNGCVCKKGYILSQPKGKCVPVDKCLKDAPCNGDSNAVIKANPIPCPSTCKTPNASPHCKRYAPAVGCECKPGYLKSTDDIDGKCIKPDTCPGGNPCGANGTFVYCNVNCPSNNCPVNDDKGIIACSPPHPCPSGCACKKNYKRKSSTDTQCILASDCPKKSCSDPNAERVGCAPVCRSTCENPVPGPCKLSCILNGCVCKKGYILSQAKGKCVPVDKCPKEAPCNGDSNAVIKANPIPCPSTCKMPNASPHCKRYAPEVGCECKPGYLKSTDDIDGKCIKPDTCPGGNPCGANGTFVYCNVNCPSNNCPVNDDKGIIACSPPHPCPSGCGCKKNYKRKSSTDTQCILASDCPKKSCSDPNAVRVKCAPAPSCRSTCAVPNPGPCTPSCAVNECVCKKGFVLLKKGGKCIPVDQCPIKNSCNGDPNAVIKSCPLPCPSTCAAPNAAPCKKACQPVGCECKDGYILSKNGGRCIRPDKCPGGNPCGKNETYVSCKVPCPSNYCPVHNSSNTVVCKTPSPCYSGCVCKINYKRRSTSGLQPRCIHASDCPKPIKCKANEVYKPCRIICPPQTCASIYSDYDCRKVTQCEPGCDCISEYLRNGTETDLCIPSSQCPGPTPVCGPNEHYEVNSYKCDPTCKSKDQHAQIGPCPKTSGCFCDKGYVRNKNGKCVPPKQCPTPVCGHNEHYEVNSCKCDPTCKLKDQHAHIGPCPTTSGCFCDKGYVRNKNGICVTPEHCPTPVCGHNEHYEVNSCKCDPTCKLKDQHAHIGPCPTTSGCFCDKGYVRNKNGICVTPEHCPTPVCGPNEHYEVNSCKCDPTCKSKDQHAHIGPCPTTSGCFCDKGYVRNKNGICVTPEHCPKIIICPANEVLSHCYNTCLKTCRTRIRGDGRVCHQACIESGCVCIPDYLRHDNGTCVPIRECSPPQCDVNETYMKCGSACPPTCQNRGDNCTACTKQCVEGCFCNKGLVRAEDGSCVKPKHCPRRTCDDPDEIFVECPPSCPATDGCSLLWSKYNCTGAIRCCKPQCRCKPGLYRGPTGKCITAKQCTNTSKTPVKPPPRD